MNDLKVLGCDIKNAYISAPFQEKIYKIAGREFGSDAGKFMIVVRALYRLKSSGALLHSVLSKTLWDLQYRPTTADPDVWIKAAMFISPSASST